MLKRILCRAAIALVAGFATGVLYLLKDVALGKVVVVRTKQEIQFQLQDARALVDRSQRKEYIPPILTVAEAQKQVPFPLTVPSWLPAGGQLLGVRVSRLFLQNPQTVRASIRKNTQVLSQHSYGLRLRFTGGKVFVHSPWSGPARDAGIGEKPVELISANGYRPDVRFETAWARQSDRAAALTVQERQRRATQLGMSLLEYVRLHPRFADHDEFRLRLLKSFPLLRQESPLLRQLEVEPLELLVRDRHLGVRKVSLPKKGPILFVPGDPRDSPEMKEPRAALLFTIQGKNLALLETRAILPKPVFRNGMERVALRGIEVWLSGPKAHPSAFWRERGIDYTLNNYQGAVSRVELLRIIRLFKTPTASIARSGSAVTPSRRSGQSPQ